MAIYSSYHETTGNKVCHFVGIPAIVWSLMVGLALPGAIAFGNLAITLAHVVVLALLAYYLRLDLALGIAAVAVFTVMLVSALQVAAMPGAWWIALVVFAGGWVFQLVGHAVWEHKRPALVDNLFQVFVAPIFLMAEVAFGLGFKKELKATLDSGLAPA